MGQCAPEDSISQCPFLQMIDTAGNPHADGSAAPGARPRHRPSRHRDPPATSRAHDNWMAARQTSCRQQTAPPPPRCSKDVTAHPHRPGARPGRPCQVPARSGQPLSGRSGFSPAFGTEFFFVCVFVNVSVLLFALMIINVDNVKSQSMINNGATSLHLTKLTKPHLSLRATRRAT